MSTQTGLKNMLFPLLLESTKYWQYAALHLSGVYNMKEVNLHTVSPSSVLTFRETTIERTKEEVYKGCISLCAVFVHALYKYVCFQR